MTYEVSTKPLFFVAKATDNGADLAVGSWDFSSFVKGGMNYGEITVKADGTFEKAVYKKIHS